ncbi:hypothetical protein C8J56DRAFT_1133658 [Mycena floridula]|nr:hypothetical protein C8J56DRAFT_1133658 [Mycena floridula]
MAATFKLSDWAMPILHNFNTIEEIDLEYGHYDGYNTLLAVMAMFLSVMEETYLTTAPQQWLIARHAANLLARSVLVPVEKRDKSTTELEVPVSDSLGGDNSEADPGLAEASMTSSFAPESEEAEISILMDDLSRLDVGDDLDDDEVAEAHQDSVDSDSSDVRLPLRERSLRPRQAASSPSVSSFESPDPSFDNSTIDPTYQPSNNPGSNDSSFDNSDYSMSELDPLLQWQGQAQATSTPINTSRVAPKTPTPLPKITRRLKRTVQGARVEQSLKERHVVPDSLTNVTRIVNGIWAKMFPGMIQEIKPFNWAKHRKDFFRQERQYRSAFNRALPQLMVQGLLSFYHNEEIQKIFGMLLIGKRFQLFLFERPNLDLIGPAELPNVSDLDELEAFATGPFQAYCSKPLMVGNRGAGASIFADLSNVFSQKDDFSEEWRQVWRTFDAEFALGLNLNNL